MKPPHDLTIRIVAIDPNSAPSNRWVPADDLAELRTLVLSFNGQIKQKLSSVNRAALLQADTLKSQLNLHVAVRDDMYGARRIHVIEPLFA
jgi:hypothetical protein